MLERLLLLVLLLLTACTEAPAPSEPGSDKNPEAPAKALGRIDSLRFAPGPAGLPSTGNFAGVAVADLDGDGRGEILSGRREEAQGLFLFCFRGGKWESQQLTTAGDYGGVALGDISGDGIPDVLAVKTAGRPKGVELFATRRAGEEFEFDPLPSPYTQGCDDLDTADLDGDGALDFVVSSRGDRVLINGGKAASFRTIELDSEVYEDTGILLADVNGDRKLDVLSANHPGKNVRLFFAESTDPPAFGPLHTGGLPLDGDIGFKLAHADFDGDGHTDLAVGTNGGLRLFRGNGCSGPEAGWWKEQALAGRSRVTIQPVFADLDRDGDPDLVYTSEEGLHIRLNDGAGGFGDRLAGDAIPEKGSYSGCSVIDWDGDGDLDIVYSSFQGNGIHLLLNEG